MKCKLFNQIQRLFCSQAEVEPFPAKDDFQRHYREVFGGIVDKYLISYEEGDGENPYRLIVYIDAENDIDWIIKNEKATLSPEILQKRSLSLAKLDIAQSTPCLNLTDSVIMTFKKMLGAGYDAALHDNFEVVDPIIDQALQFIRERNREQGRFWVLLSSTLLVSLSCIVVGKLIMMHCCHEEWLLGILMGILGAYISIWSRYGKLDLTGLAMKQLYIWESFTRIFSGAIFSAFGICLLKSEILFQDFVHEHLTFGCMIIGFIAAFNERFIPSIVEKIAKNEEDE